MSEINSYLARVTNTICLQLYSTCELYVNTGTITLVNVGNYGNGKCEVKIGGNWHESRNQFYCNNICPANSSSYLKTLSLNKLSVR